jgi:hypothetical protein
VPCCPPAGFRALGCVTSLTGLHVIRHGKFDEATFAAAITGLSCLTRLKELRCDAGYAPWSEGTPSTPDGVAQAKCWGTVLPCMPHLTRLELVEADAGDPLLCAIGNSAPQLQRLVLERDVWLSGSSKKGADAIAHVKHIELVFAKGFACNCNLQLVQVPCVKRVFVRHSCGREMQGGPAWSQETCICEVCYFRRLASAIASA